MPGSYRRADDLPLVIPVFPLDGALLLPGGQLPLNIFEPRYLNMFDDAMSGERIIGMVQTRPGGDVERPNLAPVGCAGRVTSFAETSDGRYLVTLTGVCRFRVGDELPARGRPIARCAPTSRPSRTDLREGVPDSAAPPTLRPC
jgi:Lon protease-like protein